MNVGINLGPAVLQETTNARESISYTLRILGSGRVRSSQKRLACASSILVKDEHGKDVAEQHSPKYEGNAAEDEQSTRTHGSET